MQGQGIEALIDQVNNQQMLTAFDITLMTVINIVLIFGIKLIFMFLNKLQADTDYRATLVKLFNVIFEGKLSVADKRFLKRVISSVFNYSSMIGFVERILYIIAIAISNFELLALVIAVKTIVRFPEINKGNKTEVTSEKYILGTLLNLVAAFVIVNIFI